MSEGTDLGGARRDRLARIAVYDVDIPVGGLHGDRSGIDALKTENELGLLSVETDQRFPPSSAETRGFAGRGMRR